MERSRGHVPVVENAADECEGGVACRKDDFVGELEAEVVRDENKEVREVAKGGGNLRVVVA